MGGQQPTPVPQAPQFSFNAHDIRVIAFHAAVAAVQAVLIYLGTLNFGAHTADVALVIQVVAEAIRRYTDK